MKIRTCIARYTVAYLHIFPAKKKTACGTINFEKILGKELSYPTREGRPFEKEITFSKPPFKGKEKSISPRTLLFATQNTGAAHVFS